MLIKPNQAKKYIHTADGIVHISKLFPAKMLRPDQRKIELRHRRSGLRW